VCDDARNTLVFRARAQPVLNDAVCAFVEKRCEIGVRSKFDADSRFEDRTDRSIRGTARLSATCAVG